MRKELHRVVVCGCGYASTWAIQSSQEIVNTLFHDCGSMAVFEESPFERRLRDIDRGAGIDRYPRSRDLPLQPRSLHKLRPRRTSSRDISDRNAEDARNPNSVQNTHFFLSLTDDLGSFAALGGARRAGLTINFAVGIVEDARTRRPPC
jgi:hypothetical protein